MNVGILGLGLIGGSMARAYALEGHSVYACDADENTLSFATLAGAVRGILDRETISSCDLILLAIYPEGSIRWLQENAPYVSKKALVMDLCGIKGQICEQCFPLAKKYGFTYVGGHPMAGSQFSGFKYSRADLYEGAPMVLVPEHFDDMVQLERVKSLLSPCGFGSYSVTTAREHDEMIAFTSQMPHLLSNAFIKSPSALGHKGFSAGSYRDFTRVAWLNSRMWAELFLSNRENLLSELDLFMENLKEYREALAAPDPQRLEALLEEGHQRKKEVDG